MSRDFPDEERRDNGDGHRGRDDTEKGEQPHQQRSKETEGQGPRGFENQSFKVAKSSKRAKDMVEHWVNRALDVGVQGLVDEFRSSLSKWQPEGMTTVAFLANRDKNRYLDVPCQDQRRVILNWPGLPNDYIHANYVANPARDHRFICAQGPLDNTQLAFWAMVIQEKCEAIIMLCNTIECGKFKCSQYWPHDKGEVYSVGEGEGKITVTNLDVRPMSEEDSFVRVCRLRLDFQQGGRPATHMVMHYQWENWPDRGVPPTRLTATNLLSEVRGTTKPILVHCSAGIGRTGTIVAIAYVQEKMQHGQDCMDMDALTKELRTQRPYSIQNEFVSFIGN
ncbi:Protein-tyrosine phosphatase [Ostertagia ostertagi]